MIRTLCSIVNIFGLQKASIYRDWNHKYFLLGDSKGPGNFVRIGNSSNCRGSNDTRD